MNKENVIIIGAGLAGVVIANKLSQDETKRVIVIEKGGYEPDWPEHIFTDRKFGENKTYCHAVGGSTHLWHNGLIPIQHTDVDDKGFKDLLCKIDKYSNEAASFLNYSGDFEQDRKLVLDKLTKKASELSLNISDGIDSILIPRGDPLHKPNKAVELYTNVRSIKFYGSSTKIEEIEIFNESKIKLKVDKLVISGGGTGSPILIKQLYADLQHNVDNITVGKGLIDHPMGFIGKIKVKKSVAKKLQDLFLSGHKSTTARCAFRVADGNYKHCVYIWPSTTMSNSLDMYKFKSALAASGGRSKLKFFFDKRLYHPDILSEIFTRFTGKSIRTDTFSILAIFEQRRDDSRHVTLNENGVKEIHWNFTDEERKSYDSINDKIKRIFEPVAEKMSFMKKSNSSFLWSGHHHSGTVGLDEKQFGAVNHQLRLNGLDNAYVCDASVIQSHSYANTGLTIGKLAIYLCEECLG